MKRNKLNVSKAGRSHTTSIITGVVIALVLSFLLTALIGDLILKGHLGENIASASIFVIRAVSVLVGALIGGLLLKQNYLKLVGFITAGYFIVLIGIGIVFYDGSFKSFLLGIASVLAGGVAALLILQMPRSNVHKRKKLSL